MTKLGKPITQRQLRVGEMIKQALGMIFIRDDLPAPFGPSIAKISPELIFKLISLLLIKYL